MEAKKVEALLALARDQLGIKESPPDSNRVLYNTWYYGQEVSGGAYPWCMAFVQWVFHQTGVPLPARTASCSALMRAAQKKGAWVTEDFRPGDVVVYDFSGKKGAPVHCGIVERVAKTGVTAIEGNTSAGNDANGGQVQRRERASRMVVGAVRPVFEEKEDEEITQEEFNQRFCTAMEAYRQTLRDNDSSAYSKEAREFFIEKGIVQGGGTLPDGSPNFMWEDLMTREQALTMAYRILQMLGKAQGE